MQRKGIILAGGAGTRLHPLTRVVSKQLLPVYDKPMVYYPLSTLMLAGIREVAIISTPQDLPAFERLFGDGKALGMRFEYLEQPKPEGLAQAFTIAADFLNGAPACLILGDNLFYGADLPKLLSRAMKRKEATIFTCRVSDPERYGVVAFDKDGAVQSLEEKPKRPKSNYAVTGLYFYPEDVVEKASTLKKSSRGEYEITDLIRLYLNEGRLALETMGRGFAWLDTGTHASLADATNFVRALIERQGLQIACIEEIAWSRKWISSATLAALAASYGNSTYGEYLRKLQSTERM